MRTLFSPRTKVLWLAAPLMPMALMPVTNAFAQSGPLKVIPKKKPNVVVLAPTKPLSNYERLKQTSQATRIESSQMLRENYDALAGKTIEVKGRVSGFMTTSQGRMLLVATEESTVKLNAPAETLDLESAASLVPGAPVRILASVNPQAGVEPLLTAIAATNAPEVEPLFRDVAEENSSVVVPPMTGGALPPPLQGARSGFQASASTGSQNTDSQSKVVQVAPGAPPSPMDLEAQIEAQIPQYEDIVRRHNKKLNPDQVEEIARALLKAGYQNNMDPRFLAAVIAVESDFQIDCLSSSGAMGLGQIMPFNIPEAGLRNKADAWNPTLNVHGTARLLRGHLNDYKGRADGTLLAVAAYNAGPGAVRRAGYKVPNGAQVQRYVWKVYYRYKAFAPDMFR
jgi:hypothetical protein